MASAYRIAVVGATTAAGNEVVRILEERNFPVKDIVPLERKGSIGESVQFMDQEIPARHLDEKSFNGIDIAIFTAGSKASEEYARPAAAKGSVVIDTSEAFRMEKDVPLVVPEINAHRMAGHRGIIACPGASAIQLALVLYPIHKKVGIRRIILSTYQAVSDAGEGAMNELTEQIADLFNFRETQSSVFQHQIAFDAIPQVGSFLDNAYTTEEMQIAEETKKIMDADKIRICATTVHVPLFFSHSQSVNIETIRKISPDQVRTVLKGSPGISIEDDPSAGTYPLAVYATGKDECLVGRVREDLSAENGIVLWTAMDNVRKGAALNAVQIAEHVISPV